MPRPFLVTAAGDGHISALNVQVPVSRLHLGLNLDAGALSLL